MPGETVDADHVSSERHGRATRTFRLLICPTGKSLNFLSSPICKNIPLRVLPKSAIYPPPSRSPEGRLAIVTDAGRDAVDACGALDELR